MTTVPTPREPKHSSTARSDDGRAIIEVVFLAVLLLIPTVYILIGVIRLQATTLAVAQSARDVGRLIETSPTLPTADQALAVARIALDDQHVASEGLRIVTTGRGGACTNATTTSFSREPGSDYDVCVIVSIDLPGVPTAVTGSRNTVTGVYTVHIDDLREGR
jgi:Flp pilus assembly protein TadG